MYWRIDRTCTACAWVQRDYWGRKGDLLPACPDCGAPTERAWLTGSFPTVIPDDCCIQTDAMTGTMETFTSRSEHRRVVKERGFVIRDHHNPPPGSDRSRFTTRWV